MASILRRSIPSFTKVINNFRYVPSRGLLDEDGDLCTHSTSVTILNREENEGIFIQAYSSLGFRLSTGMRVMGPSVFFPKSLLHWNVQSASDINEDSLSLFTLLEPRIDILILGAGDTSDLAKVNPNIIFYLRSKKINVELLTTEQALATFNFLNSEKRYVAGAFIPPKNVSWDSDDSDMFDSAVEHSDPFLLSDYMDTHKDGPYGEDLKSLLEESKKLRGNLLKRKSDTPEDS